MDKMFCFQCEQTCGGKGCMGCAGVCGKTAEVAALQDELTGALIGLSESAKPTDVTDSMIIEGLFSTVTNVNFNPGTLHEMIRRVHALGGRTDFAMNELWQADEDVRSLK